METKLKVESNDGVGLLTKEDYDKLFKFINENEVILERVSSFNSEEVLQHFNKAVADMEEDPDDTIIENRKLTFLFYALRNSIILNLNPDTKKTMEPLSNLALSMEMLSGFFKMLERIKPLQVCLQSELPDLMQFCQLVQKAVEKEETYFMDTLNAEKVIRIYHQHRNKVIKVLLDKLDHFVTNIQPSLVKPPKGASEDGAFNTLKTVLSLPWTQQVIACESMNYDINFPPGFQVYLMMTLTGQSQPLDILKMCRTEEFVASEVKDGKRIIAKNQPKIKTEQKSSTSIQARDIHRIL